MESRRCRTRDAKEGCSLASRWLRFSKSGAPRACGIGGLARAAGRALGCRSSARGSAGVGSEGVEPSRHWVRARCATSAPRARDRCVEAGARLPCRARRRAGGRGPVVGREGVEPSGLRLKAGCRTVRRAPRAKNYVCSVETIAIVRGPCFERTGPKGAVGDLPPAPPPPCDEGRRADRAPPRVEGSGGPRTDRREDRGRREADGRGRRAPETPEAASGDPGRPRLRPSGTSKSA
jgi:hypothetical protein